MAGEVSTEIALIQEEMKDGRSEYWRDETRQARYRELIEARENHTAAPAAAGGRAVERAALEAMMRDPKSQYWRGPRSEELQARFRELVDPASGGGASEGVDDRFRRWAAEEKPGAGREVEPATTADGDAWRGTLDDVRADFGDPEGLQTDDPDEIAELTAEVHRAQDGVSQILRELGEQDGQDLVAVFDALPDGARAACLAAISRFEPGYVQTVTAGELRAFRADQSCGGKQLMGHWGSEASRRLAVAIDGFDYARGLMGADDRAAFEDAWQSASPRQRQVVLWRLGEPR